MALYRVFSHAAGESHIEDLKLEEHPELGALIDVSEVRVQEFDGSRHRDFNPLPERRLIIHRLQRGPSVFFDGGFGITRRAR